MARCTSRALDSGSGSALNSHAYIYNVGGQCTRQTRTDGSYRQFEWNLEERRAQASGEQWQGLRRGWYFGDEAFRQELLEAAEAKVGRSHYAAERQETAVEVSVLT